MRDWAANGSEVFPVDIVHDVVGAIVETAQLYVAFPSCGIESVIHLLFLADHVGFWQIETNVVERAQILTAGKALLLIKLQPLLKTFCMLRREIEAAMFLNQGREHKLRSYHSSYSQSGSKIVMVVAQFNVIAEVRYVVAHEAFDRLAFGAHLKRTRRIGSD